MWRGSYGGIDGCRGESYQRRKQAQSVYGRRRKGIVVADTNEIRAKKTLSVKEKSRSVGGFPGKEDGSIE